MERTQLRLGNSSLNTGAHDKLALPVQPEYGILFRIVTSGPIFGPEEVQGLSGSEIPVALMPPTDTREVVLGLA